MKRYRLPEGTTPGNMPTDILSHGDPLLTNTYMVLHALASLQEDWGPFTPTQLFERIPPSGGGAVTSMSVLEEKLERLAALDYIQVEYLT